jgi:hypothetical protein
MGHLFAKRAFFSRTASNIPPYGLRRLEDAQHLRLAALYLPLNLKSIRFSVEQAR